MLKADLRRQSPARQPPATHLPHIYPPDYSIVHKLRPNRQHRKHPQHCRHSQPHVRSAHRHFPNSLSTSTIQRHQPSPRQIPVPTQNTHDTHPRTFSPSAGGKSFPCKDTKRHHSHCFRSLPSRTRRTYQMLTTMQPGQPGPCLLEHTPTTCAIPNMPQKHSEGMHPHIVWKSIPSLYNIKV